MAATALIASPSPAREAMAAALFRGATEQIHGPERLPETAPAAAVFLPDRTLPSAVDADAVVRWAKHVHLPHLLVVSSAEVHEPSHRHAGFLGESQLRTRRPVNPISRRWLDLEERVGAGLVDGVTGITVLRPTALTYEGGSHLWSRLFSRRWAAVPAGYDPSIQWLSMDQLAEAVHRLTQGDAPSPSTSGRVFHVTPEGVEPLRAGLKRRGVRALPLPTFVLRTLLKLQGREAGEADFLRYPWTVSGKALQTHMTSPLSSESSPSESSTAAAPRAPIPRATSNQLQHDPFGMDPDYIDRLGKTLFRFLHNAYWRIEWRGLDHVPQEGPAVLVGIHRGHQPWDGVMVLHRLSQELRRRPRFLLHPTLVKHPFLAPYMIRCGGLNACRENGDWVLQNQELLGIFPEGIRGAFSPYKDAYKLQSFGRHDYLKFALRAQVPVVPFVIVGSAEIFPIFAKLQWTWWKRLSEWPCLPITPTMSSVPLPSKWHALFLEPMPFHLEYGPEAAEDPKLVRALGARVKARMAEAFADLRARRPNPFFGSVFDQPDWSPPPSGSQRDVEATLPNPQPIAGAEALVNPARSVTP